MKYVTAVPGLQACTAHAQGKTIFTPFSQSLTHWSTQFSDTLIPTNLLTGHSTCISKDATPGNTVQGKHANKHTHTYEITLGYVKNTYMYKTQHPPICLSGSFG